MLFNESPFNEHRLNGGVYSGFTHPVTGKVNRERYVTNEDHRESLLQLTMQYLSMFGLWGTGAISPLPEGDLTTTLKDITLIPNDPAELHVKLAAAAEISPRPESRVNLAFEIAEKITTSDHYPRVVILSEGDQPNIPEKYYDQFCFWFLANPSPETLVEAFENRFDAILNLVAMEARRAAEASKGVRTSRQIYEQILDQALTDAELTLEPFLSRAPSPVYMLTLKTVIYVLLARGGMVPDGMMDTMESIAPVAPLDYFTDVDCKTFRNDKNRNGYGQLIVEGLLIPIEQLWQARQRSDFKSVQSILDAIQFIEDIVIFMSKSRGVFEKLLP